MPKKKLFELQAEDPREGLDAEELIEFLNEMPIEYRTHGRIKARVGFRGQLQSIKVSVEL